MFVNLLTHNQTCHSLSLDVTTCISLLYYTSLLYDKYPYTLMLLHKIDILFIWSYKEIV